MASAAVRLTNSVASAVLTPAADKSCVEHENFFSVKYWIHVPVFPRTLVYALVVCVPNQTTLLFLAESLHCLSVCAGCRFRTSVAASPNSRSATWVPTLSKTTMPVRSGSSRCTKAAGWGDPLLGDAETFLVSNVYANEWPDCCTVVCAPVAWRRWCMTDKANASCENFLSCINNGLQQYVELSGSKLADIFASWTDAWPGLLPSRTGWRNAERRSSRILRELSYPDSLN